MSVKPLPLLSPRSENVSTTLPKGFRESVFNFLQPEQIFHSPKGKNDSKFIPYVQERDHLGNLLSTKSERSKYTGRTTPRDASVATKLKTTEETLPTQETQESGVTFDNFKYLPKIPKNKVKASLTKILKPKQSIMSSSAAFLARERPSVSPTVVPAVGYYNYSDKLLHPSIPEVSFPKKNKSKPNLVKDGQTIDEIDLIQSYHKVYHKSPGGPDFMRQTNRDNHYFNKFHSHSQQKSPKEERHTGYVLESKPTLPVSRKDYNDFTFNVKYSFEVKNLPLTVPALNEKFSQIKYSLEWFSVIL